MLLYRFAIDETDVLEIDGLRTRLLFEQVSKNIHFLPCKSGFYAQDHNIFFINKPVDLQPIVGLGSSLPSPALYKAPLFRSLGAVVNAFTEAVTQQPHQRSRSPRCLPLGRTLGRMRRGYVLRGLDRGCESDPSPVNSTGAVQAVAR